MKIKLDNCKFCGNPGAIRSHMTKNGSYIVFGRCDECGASTKSFCYVQKLPDESTIVDETALEKAAAAWNRKP